MSEISSTIPSADVLSDYRYEPQVKTQGSSELGQNEFMELMIAQMENQSPLDPQDNGEFISQLAEFSSLEEMQKLSSQVENFATSYQSSQALQASAMVGRTVLVPGTDAPMSSDGTISGMVDLEASTGSLKVSIFNASGELVNELNMGQQLAGSVPFSWDGKNMNGEEMPYDQYTIKAETNQGGEVSQVTTLLSANVSSVSIGTGGAISLNLAGVGAIPLEEVREIN
jgi:flagellar basal-body rod modification protein FlgD